MKNNYKDISGQKFNKLKALKYIGKSKWFCRCDCGNFTIAQLSSLIKNKVKSCGCYRKENTYNMRKKYNIYDLSGEYGVGYVSSGEEFYFDLEDYDLIKDYCWTLHDGGYIYTHLDKHKTISMHRLIMQYYDLLTLEVDHINTKHKNDNRKQNLRDSTRKHNNRNNKLYKNNSSGYTGVYWSNKDNVWVASINYNYNCLYLGGFNNIEDALIERLKAEKEYFGEEYAPQRHLFEQYGI